MKILLTGAQGFTGIHFTAQATDAGHEVIALQGDLADVQGLKTQVHAVKPEAVVHLAAISFVGHADSGQLYAVNTVGTTNLLDALVTASDKPSKVLLASSANIYGNTKHSPIKESVAAAPVNHYAMSKLAMELMAQTYFDRLPIVMTRPFNYTGPGQAANFLVPKLVEHFAARRSQIELGNLDVEREFNDVRMVCQSYLKLLQTGVCGEAYNVCSGRPYALRELIDVLRDLTDHDITVKVNPKFVRDNEVHRLCGDPGKLLSAVGELPNFDLRDTLAWMLRSASAHLASQG